MLKEAAATVPVTAGNVTPEVAVRVLAGASTTVPPVAVCTAALPKFMSTVLVIVIGVTIVALAEAVALACAEALLMPRAAVAIRASAAILIDLFIVIVCLFCLFACLVKKKVLKCVV